MQVKSVKYKKDYILEVTFQSGLTKNINFRKGLMNAKNPMNTKYRNTNLFKKVQVTGGFLSWGRDHEMCFLGEDLLKYGNNLKIV